METNIAVHDWHPVKFIEDLKIDGEKEVICGVCEDPASGPCYKCSACNFLCHQSCSNLPYTAKHPLHPNHTFRLVWPMSNKHCDICNKSCRRCLFYGCKHCEFNLDTKCFSHLPVNKDDGHQHAFVPFLKQLQFTCEGCGEERKDHGFICSKCQLLTHSQCALFSHTIKVVDHEHLLTLTYFIEEVKDQVDIVCEACYEKVNTKYAAYYCKHCSYVAHLRCARDRQIEEDKDVTNDSSTINVNQLFSEGYQLGLIKDMNQAVNERDQLEKIKHFSHPHELIFNHEEVPNDKVCDACMQLISIPFYSCVECNYFLHSLCAKIPTKLSPNFSNYTFILLSQALTPDGMFKCEFCKHYRHGFACTVEGIKGASDIQCLKIEKFQHKGHQHPFAFQLGRTCKSCGEEALLVCFRADFALCHRCITLPLVISYKDDEHSLKLTYTAEDKFGEHYCLICEKKRDPSHWFYYCAECDFVGHSLCVLGEFSYTKIGKTYKDERHQHPLTFVRKTNDSHPCDTCGLPFGDVFLQCEECKQKIHPRFGFNSSTCLKLWKGKLNINPRIGFIKDELIDDED